MKKIIKKFLIILILIISVNFTVKLKSIANSTATTGSTTEQRAIQEVANAYYNKGKFAQYCYYRKSFLYPPEQATNQNTIYSVCSDFTYSVYYQSFGIQLPEITNKIIAYAEKYYDKDNIKTNDIIEYWQKTKDDAGKTVYYDNKNNQKNIDLSTTEGRANYAKQLLTEYDLQVGDIICYHTGSAGHALLVYDIIYDSDGNPIDAIIRESNSQYEMKTTKITKGLSYGEIPNENTGITEGTFRELYLANTYQISSDKTRTSLLYNMRNTSYFAILRPLLKDENGEYTGKYYDTEFKSDASANTSYVCTGRTLKDYQISEESLSRIEYSSIDIEKTVDVFNNSVVGLNDSLEYTIKIVNNSKETYKDFNVVENISEYVEIKDANNGKVDNNTITWTISNLEPGKTKEIKYTVKVKNNLNDIGKEIVSTGTVANIPSATLKNTISSNLNDAEKNKIKSQTENLLNSKTYKGQELISNIYNKDLGIILELKDLDITDLIVTRAGTQYYPEGNSLRPTVYLNEKNKFYNLVVSNYWGALYTNTSNEVYLKFWENTVPKERGRSSRADNIYKENFQTGDVLVYKNTQTANENVTYETEDGIYYLIYISESDKITVDGKEMAGFIGIDEKGNLKNITNEFTDLRTLLGKDYYAVLRPSMAYATEREKNITKTKVTTLPTKTNYIQNYENLDLVGGILTITYNDNTTDTISLTNENVKVTGFDNSKIGKNTLSVEYEGITTTFDVNIISKQVSRIEVTTLPTKTNYIQNYENLDLVGGILTITYNDETTDTISLTNENVKVTGFDNSKIGKNTLSVEYEGITTTFQVDIISKQISSIEVTTLPTKISYIQNYEDIDLTGGIITVTYNDETTDTISLTNENVKVTGFNNTTIGTNTLKVEYEGKIATFEVKIIARTSEETQSDNTNQNINSEKIDNSVSKNILPNAGIRKIIPFIIILLSIIAVILYKKNKDFKDVK